MESLGYDVCHRLPEAHFATNERWFLMICYPAPVVDMLISPLMHCGLWILQRPPLAKCDPKFSFYPRVCVCKLETSLVWCGATLKRGDVSILSDSFCSLIDLVSSSLSSFDWRVQQSPSRDTEGNWWFPWLTGTGEFLHLLIAALWNLPRSFVLQDFSLSLSFFLSLFLSFFLSLPSFLKWLLTVFVSFCRGFFAAGISLDVAFIPLSSHLPLLRPATFLNMYPPPILDAHTEGSAILCNSWLYFDYWEDPSSTSGRHSEEPEKDSRPIPCRINKEEGWNLSGSLITGSASYSNQ